MALPLAAPSTPASACACLEYFEFCLPSAEGRDRQPGYYNYFIENDLCRHATGVGLYGEVVVKEVWEGIDLRYYVERGLSAV